MLGDRWRAVRTTFRAWRYDLCGLAGAGVVGVGMWAIYRPAGIITWGLALLGWAFIGARVEAQRSVK